MSDYLTLDLARCKTAYIALDEAKWGALDHEKEWSKFVARILAEIVKDNLTVEHAQGIFDSFADAYVEDLRILNTAQALADQLA